MISVWEEKSPGTRSTSDCLLGGKWAIIWSFPLTNASCCLRDFKRRKQNANNKGTSGGTKSQPAHWMRQAEDETLQTLRKCHCQRRQSWLLCSFLVPPPRACCCSYGMAWDTFCTNETWPKGRGQAWNNRGLCALGLTAFNVRKVIQHWHFCCINCH